MDDLKLRVTRLSPLQKSETVFYYKNFDVPVVHNIFATLSIKQFISLCIRIAFMVFM